MPKKNIDATSIDACIFPSSHPNFISSQLKTLAKQSLLDKGKKTFLRFIPDYPALSVRYYMLKIYQFLACYRLKTNTSELPDTKRKFGRVIAYESDVTPYFVYFLLEFTDSIFY